MADMRRPLATGAQSDTYSARCFVGATIFLGGRCPQWEFAAGIAVTVTVAIAGAGATCGHTPPLQKKTSRGISARLKHDQPAPIPNQSRVSLGN